MKQKDGKAGKRLGALALVLLLLLTPVAAKTRLPHDYILDSSENDRAPIPVTHNVVGVIELIDGYEPEGGEKGKLNAPQDLFIGRDGNLYIADSGNNAVLKVSPDGKLLCAITEANGVKLNYPLGVYVDDLGDIYVADNRNQRVLHLDSEGQTIEEFVAPETELLKQELSVFDPAKIAVNGTNGYLYMLLGKQFLTLDALNQFKGLVGAEQVGFSFTDLFLRIFGSEKQREKIGKRQPVAYNNFHITPDNEIYAVSMSKTSQIKKLNSVGNNTYPGGFYGEMSYEEDGSAVYPLLVDIAVTSGGMVTVADQQTSRLYQYDSRGHMLACFGGQGDGKGRFQLISSLAYDAQDRLYVLDAGLGSLQILQPTAFMSRVHEATILYDGGHYQRSLEVWEEVSQAAANYPNAKLSIAGIHFKQGNYAAALTEYFEANDRVGYGKTMGKIRMNTYSDYFAPIVLGGAALLAGLLWLLLFLQKRSLVAEAALYERGVPEAERRPSGRIREFLRLSLLIVFHPTRGMDLIKRRRTLANPLPVVLLPLLLIAVRIFAVYATSFTVSDIRPQDASLLFEIAIVLIPYVGLGFSLYGILSILSGEMTLYETFATLSYSLTPMVILWPVLTLVSPLVSDGEAGIFRGAQTLVYLWSALLIVTAVGRLNDISVRRTAGVCILSVLGVAILLVIFLLIAAFTSQLVYFFTEISEELNGLRLQ